MRFLLHIIFLNNVSLFFAQRKAGREIDYVSNGKFDSVITADVDMLCTDGGFLFFGI